MRASSQLHSLRIGLCLFERRTFPGIFRRGPVGEKAAHAMPGFGQDYNLKALCRYANASTHWASARTRSDGWSDVPVRRFCQLPFEPTHDARVVAGRNVESHPGRSFEMRSKDGARREHDAFALSGFRERERVRDVGQPRPNEHSVGRLCKHFESDSLESPHDIDPRLPETLP